MLQLNQISYSYNKCNEDLFHDISFELNAGSANGLPGKNNGGRF